MEKNLQTCPNCGKEIPATALKCKHCGVWLCKENDSKCTCPACGENILKNSTRCPFCGESLMNDDNIVKESINEISKDINIISSKESPSKKHYSKIIYFIVAVIIAIVLVGGTIIYQKVERQEMIELRIKAHNDSINDYKKKAKDSIIKATAIRQLCHLIFFDIEKNWRSSIWKNRAYSTTNAYVKCNDFNNAIKWRMSFYSSEGAYTKLDEWYESFEKNMKVLNTPPETKFNRSSEKFDDLFTCVNRIVSFCKSPEGNLGSFGTRASELLQDIEDKTKSASLQIEVNVTEEQINELYFEAITEDINTYINNVLSKE